MDKRILRIIMVKLLGVFCIIYSLIIAKALIFNRKLHISHFENVFQCIGVIFLGIALFVVAGNREIKIGAKINVISRFWVTAILTLLLIFLILFTWIKG